VSIKLIADFTQWSPRTAIGALRSGDAGVTPTNKAAVTWCLPGNAPWLPPLSRLVVMPALPLHCPFVAHRCGAAHLERVRGIERGLA